VNSINADIIISSLPYSTMLVFEEGLLGFALVSTRVSGCVSILGSTLIICTVLKSALGLSITYHRIMCMMSVADIIGTLAMTLGPLLMPRDDLSSLLDQVVSMYSESAGGASTSTDTISHFSDQIEIWVHWWESISPQMIGNWKTCEGQGFLVTFGMFTAFAYNGSLCVYYAFSLCGKIRETTIHKYVEPALHLFPLLVGILVSIPPLFQQMYNPIKNDTWCTVKALGCSSRIQEGGGKNGTSQDMHYYSSFQDYEMKELWCAVDKNNSVSCRNDLADCYRGTKLYEMMIPKVVLGVASLNYALIAMSFIMIIYKTIKTETQLREWAEVHKLIYRRKVDNERQLLGDAQKNTKVIICQVFAYTLAYAIWGTVAVFKSQTYDTSRILMQFYLVLSPIQGVLNFIIFISHKIYNYRLTHPETTRWQVLKLLVKGDGDHPVVLISMALDEMKKHEFAERDHDIEQDKSIVAGSETNCVIQFPPITMNISHKSSTEEQGDNISVDDAVSPVCDSNDSRCLSGYDDIMSSYSAVSKELIL